MCVKYESHRTYTFYMVTLQRLHIFAILCVTLWALPPPATGSPVDSSYILSHKSHNMYHIDLEVFVFKRKLNNLQNDTKLYTVGNTLLR